MHPIGTEQTEDGDERDSEKIERHLDRENAQAPPLVTATYMYSLRRALLQLHR